MAIEIITDESLVEEMNELRLRLTRTTHSFLNSEVRRVSDGQIAAVFLDLAFEIFSVSEVPKEDVLELLSRQFDCTHMRVSMEQRQQADVQ
jgi:hypothetical protein